MLTARGCQQDAPEALVLELGVGVPERRLPVLDGRGGVRWSWQLVPSGVYWWQWLVCLDPRQFSP